MSRLNSTSRNIVVLKRLILDDQRYFRGAVTDISRDIGKQMASPAAYVSAALLGAAIHRDFLPTASALALILKGINHLNNGTVGEHQHLEVKGSGYVAFRGLSVNIDVESS